MNIITEVVKLLVPPFLLHLGYLVHYKRNIDELKNEMEKLGRVRTDVQRSVEIDQNRGRVTKEEVKNWLARVDVAEGEVSRLHEQLDANKGCLTCNVHYRVGKVSKSKIDEIKNLQSEGQFGVVSIPPPPPPGIEFMNTHDFQLYAPTESAMKQIVEALEDKKLNLIGVYGMGGVGKTTLVQETAKQLKNKGIFDRVVVATVSQKCILKEIQREIGEKLGFSLEEENESARASRLLERLKKEKRILIVLDDLWEPLELIKVGIPYSHGDGLDGKGNDGTECSCSIIITTRSQEVCNQMRTQSTVEVKVLPEADAWQLFRRSAGGRVDSPELYYVAAEVVRGCGGLPVALVTIGRSLRDKDLQIWQDAASQLKISTISTSTIPGMEERVFSSIKLSYDYLRSKETQFCFLLCCLFPEDRLIGEDELFPFVWGEEVFEGIETLREARDRLHTVLDMLKRSCLLLNVEDKFRSGVRMHDIVRDVAIWIASQEEHGFVVKARGGLGQWPDLKKKRSKCKRLSLMENRITRLPEQMPSCPHLTTLSLRGQEYALLQDISSGCFEGMKSLKVLDLNFNWVYSIPSSAAFSCLKELRVLLLDGTRIQDISLLGNMKNLEILSLSKCNIENLPQEMIGWGGMTNLKSLNLSGNRRLTIPSGVVSRLSRLEELHLLLSFNRWEAEEDGPVNTGGVARLSELASLRCLSMLEIEVPNIQLLININSGALPLVSNLSRFSIWLGEIPDDSGTSFFLQRRQFNRGMGCYDIALPVPNEWVGKLLERTEQLCIENCRGAAPEKSIYPGYFIGESGGGGGKSTGLNNLRFLFVQDVSDVEYFLSSSSSIDRVEQVVPFKRLEELWLYRLKQLKKIYHGHGHGRASLKGCLENLRVLRIDSCDSLNPILPLNIARGLLRLEYLYIRFCSSAEEIISVQEEEEEEDGVANDDNEQEEHKSLNNTGEMMMMMVLPSPNLKILQIEGCEGLKHICPMSVVAADQGFFSQLKYLSIVDCSSFEELFANTTSSSNAEHGASESNNNSVPVFPRLRELRLSRLPNFSAICRGVVSTFGNYSFPVCERLVILKCPKLKRLPLSLESAPKLMWIRVEERWFNQLEWNDPSEKQLLLQGGKVQFLSED